jgi:glycine cleavage system aminomethyltransferase T
VSLAFLTPGPAVPAESPIAQAAQRDGATLAIRHGWVVPVHFGSPELDARAFRETVAWADLSPLRKFDDHGLVLAEPTSASALEVTTQYAALFVAGPLAQETIARFCALDLRHARTGDRMPGSIARTPGVVFVDALDRFLLLFGAAFSEYMWDVVSDAGRSLGGRPAGWDTAIALRHDAEAVPTAHA